MNVGGARKPKSFLPNEELLSMKEILELTELPQVMNTQPSR